jgi:uncharacterized protein (DUF934 family)
MQKLIKDGVIVDDDFTLVEAGDAGLALPAGNVLVRLAVWQQHKAQLLAHAGQKGVLLAPEDTAEAIAADLSQLALVAVDFPAFADGRGYSTAYLLRTRFGYAGELRAVGDVLKDTLFYQLRCGFNSFAVRADKSIEAALAGLRDFSESYQASADHAEPLFRRRA